MEYSINLVKEAFIMAYGKEAWEKLDSQQRHDIIMGTIRATVATLDRIAEGTEA
jgi:hypothetical protein